MDKPFILTKQIGDGVPGLDGGLDILHAADQRGTFSEAHFLVSVVVLRGKQLSGDGEGDTAAHHAMKIRLVTQHIRVTGQQVAVDFLNHSASSSPLR